MATTIQAAAKRFEQVVRAKTGLQVEMECPDCGNAGPHDTNGDSLDPQFACAGCGLSCNVDAD